MKNLLNQISEMNTLNKKYSFFPFSGKKNNTEAGSSIPVSPVKRICIVLFIIGVTSTYTVAQSKRSLINDGVDQYKAGKFSESENSFNKALNKDQELFEGHFNLGDALYKMGKYDQAIGSYKNSLGFTENPMSKAKAFHNIGNSFLKSQQYQDAIEAYKNSLKLNPADPETKYNLSYALNMLKQDQQKKKQDKKDNKDQNKDQNKQDQKQDQNKDQNKDQKKDQNKQDQQQQPQQQKNQISKNEAERILSALKNKENDLQKKLRQRKVRVVPKEKDW